MKIRLNIVALLVTLPWQGISLNAHGQDSTFPDYEFNDTDYERFERDRVIYSPGEGETRYIPRTEPKNAVTKDSTSAKSAIAPVEDETLAPVTKAKTESMPVKGPAKPLPPKENDDSILSFNFLYYIIQKYKLQDIID